MEKKFNLVELLKDCPRGMELDCTMFENVKLFSVYNNNGIIFPITVLREDGKSLTLTKYGQCTDTNSAKCVIFPKCKTTWEGFKPPCKFKDGDIVADKKGNIAIYKQIHKSFKEPYIDFYCGLVHNCGLYNELFVIKNDEYQNWGKIKYIEIATEEEKQKLFDAIRANGYLWNAETKTLEKSIIPKFKVGEKVKRKDVDYTFIVTIAKLNGDYYDYVNEDGQCGVIYISKQDEWELVPNKFDINALKTFDQVLVRLSNSCIWMPKFFYYYDTDSKMKYYPFITTDNIGYPQCIPYNGNEHLCRTTNNCDEFYRVWEK